MAQPELPAMVKTPSALQDCSRQSMQSSPMTDHLTTGPLIGQTLKSLGWLT